MKQMVETGRRTLAAFALVGGLALAGPAAAQFSLMSQEQEKKIGAEEHPKILEQFGGVYDPNNLSGYVAEVGGRLAANSDNPQIGYTFTLLNSPVVNAFALPGGYVYITRGLLALANDEAELAGVLAHEIGHVTAHHTAQRYTKSTVLGLGSLLLGKVLGSDQIGQLAQAGSQLYLLSFSREQEFEADQLGVKVLARTGYAPIAMADFLQSLNDQSALENQIAGQAGAEKQTDFFATHPRTMDRVERAIQEAGGNQNPNAPRRRAEYLQALDGMMYGDDPKQGIIRGRTFSHPGLKFTFEVPADFRLINGEKAVVAVGPNGARIQFDSDASAKAAGADPLAYLTRTWAPNLQLQGAERLTVNGLPAASGRARVQSQQQTMDVRLVAIRLPAGRFDRFIFLTPPQATAGLAEAMQRTTYSYHILSAAEAAAVKALRIKMVTVRTGDTPESLARGMPLPQLPLERFRVLNGLKPGDALKPGQRVKVIVE